MKIYMLRITPASVRLKKDIGALNKYLAVYLGAHSCVYGPLDHLPSYRRDDYVVKLLARYDLHVEKNMPVDDFSWEFSR